MQAEVQAGRQRCRQARQAGGQAGRGAGRQGRQLGQPQAARSPPCHTSHRLPFFSLCAPLVSRSKLATAGQAASDVAAARQLRRRRSTCKSHDHLGSPAFLEAVDGNPDLLLPHLQLLSLDDE